MYRRTPISHALTFNARRRRRPTAALIAGGASAFLPTVVALAPAGDHAVTLTLQTGERVTVTAQRGTIVFPTGILLTDRYTPGSPDYLLPTPALIWEATARLGLYDESSDHRAQNDYLLSLPSLTEVATDAETLVLGFTQPDGRPGLHQFAGLPIVRIGRYEPGEEFTRFPLTATFQEEGRVYAFRIDHTPAGYAVLATLGYGDRLPPSEDRR